MFDFYNGINRNIVYPLYYWKNGDRRLARLVELEKQQYFSSEQIQSLQLQRLQQLVQYAYKHTRYYRKKMDERGIVPADIKSLSDITGLPVLTKSIIQTNLEDLLSDQFSKSELMEDASGGSTGVPTIFYKDMDRNNLRRADQIRHDRWCGWDLGERSALIWGAQRDLKAVQSVRENILSRYIERRWELDAFEMTNESMLRFTRQLEALNPSMILGYANALVAYARYLNENHPNHKIRPAGIISSAEKLSEDARAIIQDAFKCKVLNRYGSREVGLIASECDQQEGLHINADNLLVEILDGESPVESGESGDIVVTDFSNFGMPFIRYKMQDRGYLKSAACSCGRGLPLMGPVEGRESDFFLAADGTLVHGEYFTHLFYGYPQVAKFQLVQESLIDVQLKIVETQTAAEDRSYLGFIQSKVHEMLGEQAVLSTQFVEEITPGPSGKHLFTLSRVKPF